MRLINLLLSLALLAPSATAQQAPRCTTIDASLPGEIADWNGGAVTATATGPEDLSLATLALGKGYAAGLKKKADVTFAVEPEKPGGSVSYSGLFAFTVLEAGNYAVALSTPAWIEVIENGKALEPVSFGHGPACTTIRKMVVYALKAGDHTLQVAGNGADTVKLAVAKQP